MPQLWEVEFLVDGKKFKDVVTESKKRRLQNSKGVTIIATKKVSIIVKKKS